ncbi:hypothetical protein GLA29479_4556 [Lysobacter antibioticus]|uniref:Uncharacterized protein n=1 Tax=Lysobacter antibioticus TaxID=84531 RepID=A0A0S2E3M7_LYSAN|nr:hypothetical protein GLA29479_4556 [Lysobacter antibioticus]ALN79598.1 hypothetical protein LA76x_1442 [Lysobacter antibioticus]
MAEASGRPLQPLCKAEGLAALREKVLADRPKPTRHTALLPGARYGG